MTVERINKIIVKQATNIIETWPK